VLLSALDQTIVATAMPRIIEQLQGLSMYAWVTTAYMLTSTVSVPICR
jgi:MFS family permease